MLTGASFAAIAVGLFFVALGVAIGESAIAKTSLLPFGAIGLADYYAAKGERSPAVHQTGQPGTAFLRFRGCAETRPSMVLMGTTLRRVKVRNETLRQCPRY
ncbi:hypothetical protein BOX37_31355 [Nocardia mangyaensis]|uniref:Uncharacterized protein n=1 Tax=Nocardia mangyaensis TaxID=2213200 RepID=A0A1J0W049_9NOCA|nr:hypothetical protein [Nocardia mangyaensis]APE37692.1 hypothetical protein BOX37_31355 [Nocardia mangyaensis]